MSAFVRLGEIVRIVGGGTPDRSNPAYWDGPIPWVTVKDFRGDRIADSLEKITKLGLDKSASNLIPPGNIVVPTRMALGKAAINEVPIAINQDLKALIVDGTKIDRDYLHRFLLSKAKYFESHGKGATVKGITLDILKDLEIPMPPISEQRRIAAILAKADDIRRNRHIFLKEVDQLIRSTILRLLHGLSDDRLPIEELLSSTPNAIRTGPFGSQLLHSEFQDSGIPVLGIDNVVTNRFRWDERRYIPVEKYRQLIRYRVFPGDVMITIMGTTGRTCIAPRDLPECISTKHLCTITPNHERLLPEYLWATLLWDPEVRAQATRTGNGAIMEGWNMGIVRDLQIKVPAITLQKRFAAFVQKAEGLRKKVQAGEFECGELFDSLVQRAFIGKL